VKKASEYRKHAEECLALAKQVRDGEHRKQLLEMARTWNALAEDRERVTRSTQTRTPATQGPSSPKQEKPRPS
jgi:hypothetical protein